MISLRKYRNNWIDPETEKEFSYVIRTEYLPASYSEPADESIIEEYFEVDMEEITYQKFNELTGMTYDECMDVQCENGEESDWYDSHDPIDFP